MIKIYVDKRDDFIISNDEYFISKGYRKAKILDNISEIIRLIEKVDIVGNRIVSKFTGELLDFSHLSTSCKTYLNVLTNPDKVFFIGECGDDTVKKLFELKEACFYLPSCYLPVDAVENNIEVHRSNGVFSFKNTGDLYNWWINSYYE